MDPKTLNCLPTAKSKNSKFSKILDGRNFVTVIVISTEVVELVMLMRLTWIRKEELVRSITYNNQQLFCFD